MSDLIESWGAVIALFRLSLRHLLLLVVLFVVLLLLILVLFKWLLASCIALAFATGHVLKLVVYLVKLIISWLDGQYI